MLRINLEKRVHYSDLKFILITTVFLKGNSQDEKISPQILRKEIQPFHQKQELVPRPLFLVHKMMQKCVIFFDFGARQRVNFVKREVILREKRAKLKLKESQGSEHPSGKFWVTCPHCQAVLGSG